MTWARLDDIYPEHEKVWALSDAAFRLQTSAICHAAKLLSDGVVAADRVPGLVPRFRRSALNELVDRGLWHEDGHTCPDERCVQPGPDRYVIHGFLDRNPSRDKKRAEQDAAARRKEHWKQRQQNAVPNGATNGVRNASPTRPVPSRRETGRVTEEPTTQTPPAAQGGDGSTKPHIELDEATIHRNVEQARLARQALKEPTMANHQ
jgi:hypothetical protein